MFKLLFGQTLFSWVAAVLKVRRSDYYAGLSKWDKETAIRHWHHPTRGLAQRGLLSRWWFMYGIQILYDIIYHYAMNKGIWGDLDYCGAVTDESNHHTKLLGEVVIVGVNVMDIQYLYFNIGKYHFNIEVGMDRTFPEDPIVTKKEVKHGIHNTRFLT